MKKALVLSFALLLACCTPAPYPSETPANSQSTYPTTDWSRYHLLLDAFDASEKCPHLCWLGINPGVTTKDEVRHLLRASEEIDQKEYHVDTNGIYTNWYYESTKELFAYVHIECANDVVSTIYLYFMAPIKISDFVKLLGEPPQISVSIENEPDTVFVNYSLYYPSRKIFVESTVWDKTGPTPSDMVRELSINAKFDDEHLKLQPWLGFGHLQEYLPGQKLPPIPPPNPLGP